MLACALLLGQAVAWSPLRLETRVSHWVAPQTSAQTSAARVATAIRMVAPIPEPWQAYVDDDSGETYYHNPLTSESVWELPTSPPPAAEAEPSPPPPTPSSAADTSPAGVLKAKLLTLISALPDRGRDATLGDLPPSVAIRDAVEELLPLDPAARDGWMESEAWSGR